MLDGNVRSVAKQICLRVPKSVFSVDKDKLAKIIYKSRSFGASQIEQEVPIEIKYGKFADKIKNHKPCYGTGKQGTDLNGKVILCSCARRLQWEILKEKLNGKKE